MTVKEMREYRDKLRNYEKANNFDHIVMEVGTGKTLGYTYKEPDERDYRNKYNLVPWFTIGEVEIFNASKFDVSEESK